MHDQAGLLDQPESFEDLNDRLALIADRQLFELRERPRIDGQAGQLKAQLLVLHCLRHVAHLPLLNWPAAKCAAEVVL
ncbi:MAG: hypothetical protein ACRDTH_26370 [Pseudonocardiaceae bacterium]